MRIESISFLKEFTNPLKKNPKEKKGVERKPDFNEMLKESMQKTIPHTHPSVFIK